MPFRKGRLSNEQGREAASVKGKKKWKKRRTIGKRKIESKAVFWDFHGTLAYPKHLWGESVFAAARIACAPLSPPFSPADVKEYTKAGWYPWDRYEEDFSRTTGEKWWEFMCGHFCRIYKSLGLSEDAANRASLLVRDELTKAERYELYPDAIPALRECRSLGWKNVLLSNHLPELPRILESLGCREYFSALVISSLAGYDKPRRRSSKLPERGGRSRALRHGRGQSRRGYRGAPQRRECAQFLCITLPAYADGNPIFVRKI